MTDGVGDTTKEVLLCSKLICHDQIYLAAGAAAFGAGFSFFAGGADDDAAAGGAAPAPSAGAEPSLRL